MQNNINIYLNDAVMDQQGFPLVVLNIGERKAVFTKQLSNLFEGSVPTSDLLRKLRTTGGYEQGEGWDKLTYKEIEEIQTCEKTMSGKSAIANLLKPLNPNGASIVYEEGALWLLARSNSIKGREFAKMLVKTFIAVRDGEYIAVEGHERIQARNQYTEAEKDLKKTIYDRGVKDRRIGYFIMRGDQVFYGGNTTDQMRHRKGIPPGRALADFDTSIELTAKTLIKKATDKNIQGEDMKKEQDMLAEYVKNNQTMREALKKMGVIPEDLPAEEDYKVMVKREQKKLKSTTGIKRLT